MTAQLALLTAPEVRPPSDRAAVVAHLEGLATSAFAALAEKRWTDLRHACKLAHAALAEQPAAWARWCEVAGLTVEHAEGQAARPAHDFPDAFRACCGGIGPSKVTRLSRRELSQVTHREWCPLAAEERRAIRNIKRRRQPSA